jgi:hypothetical protein
MRSGWIQWVPVDSSKVEELEADGWKIISRWSHGNSRLPIYDSYLMVKEEADELHRISTEETDPR